ncbi:MAG: hypothetical protein LBK91_07530, partial [Synergistaceae bacterium]|nr:hypothetical protein [Synergistaceae bacterium]
HPEDVTAGELAALEPGKKAVVSIRVEGAFANFKDVPVSDIDVFKLQSDKNTVYRFPRAAFSGELKAGQYAITKNDDFNITVGSSERLEGGEVLYVAIEDDGALDYDKTTGQIFDPHFIGAKHNSSGNTGAGDGAGGGVCDAGFGAGAVVFFLGLGFCLRRKR